MTSQEVEALEMALRATRRQVSVLDTELARLANVDETIAALLADADADIMPAFVEAIGSDGQPGIPFPSAVMPQASFGMINLPADAPFVATGLLVALKHSTSNAWTEALDVMAQFNVPPEFGFRFFDAASSSELVNFNKDTNGFNAQFLPVQALASDSLALPGDWAIPETQFPAGGSVRVELYRKSSGASTARAFVVLAGYKIFGD